jgi:hypothetical protein
MVDGLFGLTRFHPRSVKYKRALPKANLSVAAVADVTGHGKKDLVILVHARILVYPQA